MINLDLWYLLTCDIHNHCIPTGLAELRNKLGHQGAVRRYGSQAWQKNVGDAAFDEIL